MSGPQLGKNEDPFAGLGCCARHEINYLQEKYGWELPQGDYDTLAGLIISATERIPELNETVEIASFVFTIIALEDTRIDTVRLTVKEQPVKE